MTKQGYTHFAPGSAIVAGSTPVKILAVAARNSKDIWILTDSGVVLQDDGKQITFRQAKPCGWGEANADSGWLGSRLYNIVVDEAHVHVFGEYRDTNTRVGGERRASLARNGKWTCSERSLVPDHLHASGTLTWRAAHNMDDDACRIGSLAGHCTSGPRFAPTHIDPPRDGIDMGIYNVALWMHAPDDGWVVTKDELFQPVLYRFNGVTWAKVVKFDEGQHIHAMWADEQHHVWLTAGAGRPWESHATMLLRYDGKTLAQMPTPASFSTRIVRGSSSRNVWFGGAGDMVYQWDGSRLRQAQLSGDVGSISVSPDGAAFFALPEAIAFALPEEKR